MSADREHSIDSLISLREYVEMLIDHEQELREQMQMEVRRAHDIACQVVSSDHGEDQQC
jgi:hypothetical protein